MTKTRISFDTGAAVGMVVGIITAIIWTYRPVVAGAFLGAWVLIAMSWSS